MKSRSAIFAAVGCLAAALSPAAAIGQQALTVDEAVRRALATHPTVGAAEARLDETRAAVGEARSAWFPSITVGGHATRFQEPMLVAPLHSIDLTTAPDFELTLVQGQADMSWTLFEGGARPARVRGAGASASAASYRAEDTRQQLAGRVVSTYAGLLTLDATRSAQRARREALLSERDRVERMLAEGLAPEVERFRAEAEIARVDAALAETEARIGATERELARLVGASEPVPAESLAGMRLASPDPSAEVVPLDPSAGAANGPEPPAVEAAAEAVRAAAAARSATSASWFPRVSLDAGLRSYGSGAGHFTTEWQAGVGLSYPLFTGLARSKRVAEASAREDAAREELRAARLFAADGVDRALQSIRGAAASAAALAVAQQHLEEVTRIERIALEAGTGIQTDYLRAEADLADVRASRAQAENAHVVARAELARAQGRLTPEWLRANLETAP